MDIMTKDGWKQLQPLFRGYGCYSYPNAKEGEPVSSSNGIPAPYRGVFVMFQGIRMSVETYTFVRKLQRENAELKADRIERRGHEDMFGGESDEYRELNRRRDKYGVPFRN